MAQLIRPGQDGGFEEDADLQLQSTFFGRLPREVRDMIYDEFWKTSGTRQHVFNRDNVLTHFPCIIAPGEKDERNEKFEEVWLEQQKRQPRSLVVDHKWAVRISSPWGNHWRCEEAMKTAVANNEKAAGNLFLSALLACKRMYIEALPSMYASASFVFTDLETAYHCLVSNPSSTTPLIRSLSLSLSVPYKTLHYHRYEETDPMMSYHWAELCTTLSNLVRFADLQQVHLRLDLADDRFWWEVRERWALSPIRGMLARCLTVQLPRIRVNVERLRPYQFKGDGSDHMPAFKLERYDRLRWMGEENGAVQARLEFFNPREHVMMERDSRLRKMRGLFRGFLMG